MRDNKLLGRMMEPLAELYRGGARARRQAYDQGKRPRQKLPRPVISVGNLTVGGTGKTPLVLYLCKALSGWCHVAVLSRGYGRKNPRDYVTVPDPSRLDDRAALFFGDEPVMLARNVTNTSIHLGPNRYKSGMKALATSPVDVFVLDDGFQHIELNRELDIVLLNGRKDPRELLPLPAGPLREAPETIARADIVVINHCGPNGEHEIDLDWLGGLCPKAPIVLANYAPIDLFDCKNQVAVGLDEICGNAVYGFCGIAEPTHFKETMLACGANLVGFEAFGDHHHYRGREIQDLERRAVDAGATALITTEKDAARLMASRIRGLPIYALRVEMKLLEGEECMWELIGDVLNVG